MLLSFTAAQQQPNAAEPFESSTSCICASAQLNPLFYSDARMLSDALRAPDAMQCTMLELEPPELYVRQNPSPNAYTLAISGRKPFIVVHTALLELLTPQELQAVLAHGEGGGSCGVRACMEWSKRFSSTDAHKCRR
jgi:hypothetical protein